MKGRQRFFAFLVILLIALSATAQEGEPVQVIVTYECIHVNDTNHRQNPIKENMVLCVGEHSSKYTNVINESYHWRTERGNRILPTLPPSAIKVARGGSPFAIVYGRGYTQDCLYQYLKENKLNKTSELGTIEYLIESPLLGYIDSTGQLTPDDKAQVLLEQYRKETLANTNNPLELKTH